jgi:hypothetical protein
MDNKTPSSNTANVTEAAANKASSIVDGNVEKVESNQMTVPTIALLGGLIVAFLILKSFVYIKDKKRDGK